MIYNAESEKRRKIRLIESDAKCRYLKNRDFAAGVYLSEAPSPPRVLFGVVKQLCRFAIWSNTQCITLVDALHTTQSPPPPVTQYINTYPCTYSHREWGRGGEVNQ